MARADVVSYLAVNLNKFPVDDLREQLRSEGVGAEDFEEALKVALRTPPPAKSQPAARRLAARLPLIAGTLSLVGALFVYLNRNPTPDLGAPPPPPASSETAFVGHYGYVLRLPLGYAAVQGFRDARKTVELVHLCKSGTDPTNLLNEGLYGQLGIVRLEVQPSPFAGNSNALEALTQMVTNHSQQRGEKYTVKTLEISSLRGIQVSYEAPFPRVEAYVLGHTALYSFMAGQDDEIYREIITSLRDTRSES